MEAPADTIHSKEAFGPLPVWRAARESSNRAMEGSQACSSRRTMRLSWRALERQCTRRRSSPWRYSRTRMSSWPWAPTLRGVEEPDLPAPASELSGARGCTLGVTMRWLTVRKEWSA